MNAIALLIVAAFAQSSVNGAVMSTVHQASSPIVRLSSDLPQSMPDGTGWRPLAQGSGYVRDLDVSKGRKGGRKHSR